MQNYYMDFTTQVITKSDGKHYFIEGYASTIDKDLAEDVVDKSAQMDILESVKNRTITLDLEHERFINKDGTIADRPHAGGISVGKVVHAELRSKGVWIEVELNQHIERFKSIWNSIKNNFLNAFSVAFRPVEIITKETENGIVRIIKRLNLYNIALTGEAANPNATFKPVMKSLLNKYKKEAINMSEEKNDTQIDLKSVNKRLDSIEESVKSVIKNKELEDKINDLGTRVEKLEKVKDKPEPKEDEDKTEEDKTEDKPEDTENTVKSNSKIKLKSTIEQTKEIKKEKETNTSVLDLF